MDVNKLEDLKEIAYKNADAESYAVFLATLVWKAIPQNIKAKLTQDANGTVLLDDTKVLDILKDILPKFVGEDEFSKRLSDAINARQSDMQELYDILTVESIKEVVKEENIKLIAEAENEEEVKDTTKDLTDILNKDAVPNILKAIAAKVQGEVKKSNEQLEKIEQTETNLINTATGDDDNAVYNDNDTDIGSQDANDTSGSSNGDTVPSENDNSASNEDDNKENKDKDTEGSEGETEVPKDEPDDKSAIAGDDGEVYAESVRVKYAQELYKNFVYRIKNSVSKYVYESLKDGQEVNDTTKAFLGVATYGIITFGYLLDDFDIYPIEEFAKRCEAVLSYSSSGEGDL
ncbi:hypothetical protein JDFnp4_105 [Fusobacterium phage JD-Fnp4]|nr:hypothetical protein JDFnp4_105 [Fusobacterium phage JD-Fnp4]